MTYAQPARNFMAVLTNAAIAAFYEQFCCFYGLRQVSSEADEAAAAIVQCTNPRPQSLLFAGRRVSKL